MERLRAEDLSFRYNNSGFSLADVNLSIRAGELVLVTGPSGSGKTTLAYCLSGIIPHCIKNGRMMGRVLLNGSDTRKISLNEMAREIGIVLQNPESQIFGMSVEEDIAFGLENLCLPRDEIERRVEETLNFLGLENYKEESPDRLSGGQKQRLVIGSVMAMKPEILVLDEPLSNLDPQGTRMVLSTLISLRELGKTIILIERKIEHILPLVDRIVAIYKGRVVADTTPRKFFSKRELVEKLNIQVPQVVRLFYRLKEAGIKFDCLPLTVEEFVRGLNGGAY